MREEGQSRREKVLMRIASLIGQMMICSPWPSYSSTGREWADDRGWTEIGL